MYFDFSFHIIALSIIKLFLVMSAGYLLYYFKLIDDKFTDTLSLLLIRLIFPALIISKTIEHFDPGVFSYWWALPLAAMLFSLFGIASLVFVLKFFFNKANKKEFICCSTFQNCGYLPMNIIYFSFAGLLKDRLLIFLFLFIFGFNFLMWSLVPMFFSEKLKDEFKLKLLLNPPVLATLFSVLWVLFLGRGTMPSLLLDPLSQVGQASFPMAMIALGAYLCRYKAYAPEMKKTIIAVSSIKLFIYPLVTLVILKFIKIPMDYKFFLFLQSTLPTAISLVIIGSYTRVDNKFIASSIFYTHLISLVSIPLWLAIFKLYI